MDDLRTQYKGQLDSYEKLLNESLDADDVTQIPKLRTLNVKLAFTIDELETKLTFLKENTPNIKQERDELIQTLARIQQDYSGLIVATDSLETLRRIRQQVKFDADRQLRMYLLFFFLLSPCIVFYLMFMTQRKDTTAAIASTPPTMAALV
jgi:chromosome condensin MukBEF ATPase and DNA-binding subunit MukB